MPYEGNHPYPEEKTLAQLQNRWDRHVSICKQCQQVCSRCGVTYVASAVPAGLEMRQCAAEPISRAHVCSVGRVSHRAVLPIICSSRCHPVQTAAALTKISAGLGIAVWASGFAAVWLAATGSPALGAPTFLTVPVAVWVAAVTAGLAALRHTVDAKYEAFHIPERVGEYPLIRPASFSKPASDKAA